MKIVMVGRDKAPSVAFEALQARLVEYEGVELVAYLGHGSDIKATLEEVKNAVRGADVLLCGMSSSAKLVEYELAAMRAAYEAGVPVVMYADQHVTRGWFESVRQLPSAVLVVSQKEADLAREFFPNAEPIVSGNPDVETAFFPNVTREQARARLGVKDDEKMILVPGYKFPGVTMPTVIATVNALRILDRKFFLVVSLHPGDEAWKSDVLVYDKLIGHLLIRDITDFGDMRYLVTCGKHSDEAKRIPTADITPGADVVVATMSTEEEKAACLRIPVVEYLTELDFDRMEKNSGTRFWEPTEKGIVEEVVGDHEGLAFTIEELLDLDSELSVTMRKAQELHYPRPDAPGQALRVMAETVRKYGSHKK